MRIEPLKIKGTVEQAKNILRQRLLDEATGKCPLCKKGLGRSNIHHRDGCGLNWVRDNLIILCYSCHNLINHKPKKRRHTKELGVQKRLAKPAG